MNGNTALLLTTITKCLAVAVAIAAAGYLALQGKDGWGWFLLLAYAIAPGSLIFD